MSINSSAGTKLYICATANPTATDSSTYAALTWVEVNEVETIPEFGDAASAITYTSLSDSRVRKLKGAYDAGSLSVTMAHDPSDAGQTDCATAALTPYSYAFKVVAADAANASATDSVRSSFSRSARATERPICATSMEWVRRVRNMSPS